MRFLIDKKHKKGKVAKGIEEENWDLLINETKPKEKDLTDIIVTASEEMQNNIDDPKLLEGIKDKNSKMIEESIPVDTFENNVDKLGIFMTAAFLYGAINGKKNAPPEIKNSDLSLNVQDEKTLQFIKERTGDLIKQITEETKSAVKQIIKRAYKEGYGPDISAKQIKNIVGLTVKQALAVDNYMNKLINEGVNPNTALNKSKDYAKRLREFRAETIARTEIMRAMNEGHQALISKGIKIGLLDEDNLEKTWWTALDERVCPICGAMHNVTVEPNEKFNTANGEIMVPPAHPRCRCVPLYRRKK